jgi:uncharacterized membrane protein
MVPASACHYEAWLRPHRSLTRRGLGLVLAAAAIPCFGLGLLFLHLGAWPVSGFLGLDVALLWLAFRLNNRDARQAERLRLSDDALTVDRLAADGTAETWRFQPYWLRVAIDEPPRPDTPLILSSHGRSLTIGRFLPPEDRLDAANALRAALRRWRERGPSD